MIKDKCELMIPAFENIKKSGIKVECIGIIIPTKKTIMAVLDNFHFSLVSANAAVVLSSRHRKRADTHTINTVRYSPVSMHIYNFQN